MSRHGRPADRKLLSDLVYCPVTLPKNGEDLAPVPVGERVENSGLTWDCCTSEWRRSVTRLLP